MSRYITKRREKYKLKFMNLCLMILLLGMGSMTYSQLGNLMTYYLVYAFHKA